MSASRLEQANGLYSGTPDLARHLGRKTFARDSLQNEVKCCSSSHFGFCPDSAAMAMNDLLDGCQSDSGAWKIAFIVKALEGAEQLIGIFHIESGTVVAHKVNCWLRMVLDAKFDPGIRVFGCKFPRISEKIF